MRNCDGAAFRLWFEDYNGNAPHKALRMLSSREFIRSLQNLDCAVEQGQLQIDI